MNDSPRTQPGGPAPIAVRRRSLLYVPGDRPSVLAKAGERGADGLILNLEDAVPPGHKQLARDLVSQRLSAGSYPGAEVIVRVNRASSAEGFRDMMALAPLGPSAIMLPKVSSVEEVRAVSWLLDRVEDEAELGAGHIKLMCMIESAAGVLAAPAIATSSPRLTALLFGAADFSEDIGCELTLTRRGLLTAMSQIVLAARAAQIDAIDAPHMALTQDSGLQEAIALARELGFSGKSAIHPSQVAPINAGFTPQPVQVAWAQAVLAAFADAEQGIGAAVLEGELIEAPHVLRARRILAQSET